MAQVNPYLNFNGNCEEAFDFYHSVFGGEAPVKMRFRDVPSEEQVSSADGAKIMHTSLMLGEGHSIMGSDIPAGMGSVNSGNNVYISINTSSEEEADKIYNGLSSGGKAEMPMDKVFWGSYFGMLSDKFGFHWMISYEYPEQK